MCVYENAQSGKNTKKISFNNCRVFRFMKLIHLLSFSGVKLEEYGRGRTACHIYETQNLSRKTYI